MHIYAIRHGQTDYEPCRKRGFIGQGLDLAPLTPLGISQIRQTALDPRLQDAEVILTSPYHRALHSAAILSKELDKHLIPEIDLHEWMPDQTFYLREFPEFTKLLNDFEANKGVHPPGTTPKWESVAHLRERVCGVLDEYYEKHESIIMVCHGFVIRSLSFRKILENGEIVEIDYHPGMEFPAWGKLF